MEKSPMDVFDNLDKMWSQPTNDIWFDVNFGDNNCVARPFNMQAQALDTSFVQSLVPPDPHANGFGAQNGLTDSSARSQSRSTDSSTDGSQSNGNQNAQTPSLLNNNSAVQHNQIPNLNVALQQAAAVDVPSFPTFNQQVPDLFGFHNNSLPYPMLSQFGRLPPFETKPDVGQLQMQMREAKPYKCTQCAKSFANSSYLSQHMRIHLGIKPFGPCQYCGKKFTQLSHLQQHIRTHTGEKPYKCKYQGCEKAFSQLSNLQSHSRCHQTDKPFKCNSCYKCFSDEQSLLEHIPKHKESKHLKVHICPFCGKSYTQATYLQKHMTKHADRTRGGLGFRADAFPTDPLAMGELWSGMPGAMGDHANDAQQFAINQFANQAMMSQLNQTQAGPYNAANSAFSLLNFRNNRFYDQFPQNIKPERPAGFNMITPLENIQRYTQGQGATATAVTAAGATATQQHPFAPSLINQMKPPAAY